MSAFVPIPFPSARYFLRMLEGPITLCDTIRWERQDVFNRYTILTDKGLQRLTIPVEKPAPGSRLAEVRISHANPWRQQHERAIASAYSASPYFEYFEDDLANLFKEPTEFLIEFSWKTLTFCLISLKNIREEAANAYFSRSGEDCWQKIDIITLRNDLADPLPATLAYRQVFGREFVGTISILDAIFCAGPRGLLIPSSGALS